MERSSVSGHKRIVDLKGEKIYLPRGFKFRPQEEEIIKNFLYNKILEKPVTIDLIPTVDVYGYGAPEFLPFGLFQYGADMEWYFFATRTIEEGKIMTSDGYWNIVTTDDDIEILDGDKVVGFLRILQFVYAEQPTEELKHDWFIHEYRASPSIFATEKPDDTTREKISNFVVCKVFCEKPDAAATLKYVKGRRVNKQGT